MTKSFQPKTSPSFDTGDMVWNKPIDFIADNTQPYLLVVEDNLSMLNYLVGQLKKKYNVYSAQNGIEAIAKLEEVKYVDLIISDVMMDEMDGFTFYSSLTRQERFRHIPFIFLTAKTTDVDRITGLKLGAIDYICKPFNIKELVQKIESILDNLKRQRHAVVDQAYKSIIANFNAPKEGEKDNFCFEEVCKELRLTTREVEIVELLAKALTQNQIADRLHLSPKTVSKHIQNIYSKAGVSNKIELLRRFPKISSLL